MTIIVNGSTGITFPDGITQSDGFVSPIPIVDGGTGQSDRQAAMDALAGSTTNGQYLRGNGTDVVMGTLRAADMTGTLSVSNGGTGQSTLTANHVLLGNGTSGFQAVDPGSSGNVLTSNGTTWTSSSLPAGGVTSLNGATGAITNTTFQAIGSYVLGLGPTANSAPTWNVNSTYSGGSIGVYGYTGFTLTNPQTLTGTWRALGSLTNASAMSGNSYFGPTLFVRIS
jgi:hypothetical protein